MKVDYIIKNAKIYTVNETSPWAEAMAIKDGKIVYVGSNEGVNEYEGEVHDLNGQFVMPGLIDSHVHIALACASMYDTPNYQISGVSSKKEVLDFLKKYIEEHKDNKSYDFYLFASDLNGELLTRDELDALPTDAPITIMENEHHSIWVNTTKLKIMGIDEYEEDIAKGLSYFDRDPDGRINGRIYEFCTMPKIMPVFPDGLFDAGIQKILDFWKKIGVVATFDAGMFIPRENIEPFFLTMKKFDDEGKLDIYVENCFGLVDPRQLGDAVKNLKLVDKISRSKHHQTRTMKMMMDGTLVGRNAGVFEPYSDTNSNGGTLVDANRLKDFLIELNKEGIDFHAHTVGERTVATALDAVEAAKKELGDDFKIQVTLAHLETLPDSQINRFKELGVIANFTPNWFGRSSIGGVEDTAKILGDTRANHMYRINSIWNTGATVSMSTDYMTFDNMKHWNPYMGMEVGITRQDDKLTTEPLDSDYTSCPVFPSEDERMTMDKMIKGYTINAAKQLRLDDKIGSLEVGKEASYLVFEKSLFDVDVYQIHNQLPKDVYIRGKKVNG